MQLLEQASGAATFESVSPEAYLLCAERAIDSGRADFARVCVEQFLNTAPPKDQFLARAYFVLGRIQVRPQRPLRRCVCSKRDACTRRDVGGTAVCA